MRAWLLTNSYYGTWLPGDARGSVTSVIDYRFYDPATESRVEHSVPGSPVEDPIPGLERAAEQQLKGDPVCFDLEMAGIILAQFQETAAYRSWRLLAVSIMNNHMHWVVVVPDDPSPQKILVDFKAYGSRALNRRYGKPPSGTWWTENGSKRKLPDDEAISAAQHYVLYKQPNPLLIWSSELGRIK